jgi:hypothetical protein
MPQTADQRRASDAVAAWLARRHRNPAWLVAVTKADPGTIADFLNGTRWPKLGTQGRIEDALGWPPGTIRQIGFGGDVPEDQDETVGASGEDAVHEEEDTLLYRRPEGLTDEEWEQVKRESRGFIEWQIQRAAQER